MNFGQIIAQMWLNQEVPVGNLIYQWLESLQQGGDWTARLILLVLIALPIVLAGLTLRRIDLAALKVKAPIQFYIVDLMGAVFLLQLPLVIGSQIETTFVPYVIGVLLVVVVLIAIPTFRSISRAGIRRTPLRALFSMLIVPSCFFGAFSFPIILLQFVETRLMYQMFVLMLELFLLIASVWLTFSLIPLKENDSDLDREVTGSNG